MATRRTTIKVAWYENVAEKIAARAVRVRKRLPAQNRVMTPQRLAKELVGSLKRYTEATRVAKV